MTKSEVITLLERIKANYQSFSQENYVLTEWYSRLKDYDAEDVYKKFDEHLHGELNSQIPKIHFITKYLTKSADKGKTSYKVWCPRCNAILSLIEYQNHIERHNSIDFMKSHKDMFKKFDEEQLMKMSNENFNKGYDQWLEKLCNDLFNKSDKTLEEMEELQRLQNYFFSKEGMPISKK